MTETPGPGVITIASGPQNARIDPRSGLRFYRWGDRSDLISVTSARTEAGMPHGLHQWTLNQVIDRAVDHHDELLAMLTRERRPRERVLEKNRREEARKWLRLAATEQRDRDAARGTAVHDYAARGIQPEDVPDLTPITEGRTTIQVPAEVIRPRLVWFYDWLRVSGATVIGREFQIWNLTEGYAGSGDLLVLFPNGHVYIVDIKTGDGTYPEHAMQVCGYSHGEFVGSDDVVDDYLTQWLARVQAGAVLHLSEQGWDFVKLDIGPATWEAFRAVLRFARWSLGPAHADGYILARRRFPDVEAQGQAVVDSMAAELDRRTTAA